MAGAVVVQNEIVYHQRSARLERLAEFAEGGQVHGRPLLVDNVRENREVILRGAEVRRVQIPVNRLETVRDAKVPHESASDLVDVGPIQLSTDGLFVHAEPHG